VIVTFVVSAGCRDSPAVSSEHSPPKGKSDSIAISKPSCPKSASSPLDAPLRHEKWASIVDVTALRAAASRMNANRAKLDGQPRVDLLKHGAAVSSAEGALNNANLTIDTSCANFIRAYSEFQDFANSLQDGNEYRHVRAVSAELRSEIDCWSIATDRRVRIDEIARQVTSLQSVSNGSPPKATAAVTALRERWALLEVALRERESASARYVQAADDAASVIAKAATTARLSPSERTALSTAYQELPKIHLIEQQLRFIADYSQAVSDENRIVLPRDLMCWTLRLVETPSVTQQDTSTGSPAELHEQWQQRLEAVHDLIDQALAVPGAEW